MGKHPNVLEIETIFEQMIEIQARMNDGTLKPELKDTWQILPRPDWGFYVIGDKGEQAVEKLVDYCLGHGGLVGRLQRSTATKDLKKEISDTFLRDKKEISEKSVARMLSRAIRRMKTHLRCHEFFFPAHLAAKSPPQAREFGRVRVRHRSYFQRDWLAARRSPNILAQRHNRNFYAKALKHYRNFDWTIEISTEGLCRDTAERLSRDAADAFLCFLMVALGSSHSEKMSFDGPTTGGYKSLLSRSNGSDFSGSWVSDWPGSVGLPDDWLSLFDDPPYRTFTEAFESAITAYIECKELTPAARRFLDSIWWFGDGVRETRRGAKIVKFLTAVECLTITSESDEIASVLSKRVGALLASEDDPNAHIEWSRKAKRSYSQRSLIIHGHISPNDQSIDQSLYSCERVAAESIFAMGSIAGENIMSADATDSNVEEWFENRSKIIEDFHFQRRDKA
jgi:hypothetical protein